MIHLREAVVERVAGTTHGPDRILFPAWIENFPKPPDVHIDGSLVDVDISTPDAVEQLLAAEDAARMLKEIFQEPVFCRPQIDGPTGTGNATLLAIEFDVAIGEDSGKALGAGDRCR